ncbi:flavodoxin domain-containing protein [Leptolinea tardivitalis]|uniref:Flavodoxin-like domain-containing protein n=1 Tax=Leptolinea tardivitalis TaxID=229920 RepID=A0A0P6WSD4_9CHLR|nr:flavodoxin domain-containing protein [Leptolinea tardivitalis]KPL71868.1 hypothetical protein ADM99_10685 [Leptolinea tardivitalis]GAP20270.1 flavodoxin [Leptolinea tardivitalis]
MSEKILVTYATKYGSTQGVAKAIADELQSKGFLIDFYPAREVKSLSGYDAVVLGSPLYIGSFLSDASRFLSRFKSDLERIPCALFVLGPLEKNPRDMVEVQVQLDNIMNRISWFKPMIVEIFTGAMDIEKFRFPDSLLKIMPVGKDNPLFKTYDGRDWEAIRAWADSLPKIFEKQPV